MNSSSEGKFLLSVAFVLFTLSAFAAAGSKPSAPASHPSGGGGGSHAAQAPQQHGGNAANRGPGGQSQTHAGNAGNRGPGGQSQTHAGNAGNRGPGGQNQTHAGNTGNRGPGGQNQTHAGNTGNRAGGSQAGNRAGNTQGNRAAGSQANHAGGNTGNRAGGNQAGNRAGGNAANRGNQSAGNHQPKGATTHTTKSGAKVTTRANGSVRSISGHGVTVNHGLHGGRRVVATHNGRTVVATGRHGGYSQRAFYRHGGHEYVQRTYWRGGHAYAYGYRGYYYGGYPYYGYAPAYYYGPAYYGWAYNPWPAPIAYGWGWGGAPWYGYYGAYWNPYPVYPSAAFWLADYFIAASLQAAYADQAEAAADSGELLPPQFTQENSDVIASLSTSDPLVAANLSSIYGTHALLLGGAPASSGPAMTKEIKDALSQEIKDQIAAEKTAAANKDKAGNDSGPPAALDPNIRYFLVANQEDLTTSDGNECILTGGDVIFRTGDKPDDDHMVDATVKSSRKDKDECPVGATVSVSTDDIMDMYNNMRQNMADGMKEMAAKNGKNGLPKAPDTSTTAGEIPAPTPDSNVESDLNQAQKDADAAEADAKQPN